jgi:hypothetical protein
MPALILFASGGSGLAGQPGQRSAQLKVTEDPEDVVNKLGSSENGFAELSPANTPGKTVWINRDQVRMVRPA